MGQEMLLATQQAAWAAQSAADAAWWGLLLNGLAASSAVAAVWFAVVQGTRAARLERLRIGSLCYAIGQDLEIILTSYSEDEPHKKSVSDNAQHLTDSGALRRARAQLQLATTVIIPDAKAQEEVGFMLMILDFIEADIRDGNDGREWLDDVVNAASVFALLGYKFLGRLHPYRHLRGRYT